MMTWEVECAENPRGSAQRLTLLFELSVLKLKMGIIGRSRSYLIPRSVTHTFRRLYFINICITLYNHFNSNNPMVNSQCS